MELEGTIIMELPLQEGISKAGRAWKKKEWVLETPGTWPRKVKFHVFGDRVDQLNFEVGKSYAVSFELESREFNGRWYTDVNVLGARPVEGMGMNMGGGMGMGMAQPMQQPMQQAPAQPMGSFGMGAPQQPVSDPFAGGDNNTDDLPF